MGKFGLVVQNEAGRRLIEFCKENAPVIANTLLQQHKRRLYTLTSPDGWHQNQTYYILCSQSWRSSIQSAKTRPGADCGSDHELLIAKFRLKLKKAGKTTRPFRYDLNQIPYNYAVVFQEIIIEDSLPTPPYAPCHLLWIKTRFWWGQWWFLSLAPWSLPFHITYSIHFSFLLPITICFKNGIFLLCFSRGSQSEIWSRRFLILFSLKHQSDEHNQGGANDFQHLIWIFWVCQLSLMWCHIDCSPLMSWFDHYNFNWSIQPWSIVQQDISSAKVPKPFLTHTISHRTFSKHYTNLFYISVLFLPFLK